MSFLSNDLLILLFFLSLLVILGLILGYSWYYGITPTPTSNLVKLKLLEILPEKIKGPVKELGSGWGNLAFALAEHFPHQRIQAYEISIIPYVISKIAAKVFFSYPHLEIIRQDFFQLSFESTDLIVCYLYPEAMERLRIKFEKELSPKAYVISHTFAIHGWKPVQTLYANDLYHTPLYLYQAELSIPK